MGHVFYSVLLVCLCVSAVVVWYIARRNPNPRFRPRPGEIVLLSIIAVGMSGGMAYVMSGVFGSDASLQEQMVRDMDRAQSGRKAGGSGGNEDPMYPVKKEEVDESIPPWMRDAEKK